VVSVPYPCRKDCATSADPGPFMITLMSLNAR